MRQRLIQPRQMKVANKVALNLCLSSRSKRHALVIAPSNKSRSPLEQDPMAGYPTFPKEYYGNPVAQNTFDVMRFLFEKHQHTYDEDCKKTWLAIVSKHLDTSPADVSLSQHPLYKQAMKKPNWAYLVFLRQMFGHRAVMNSKLFKILQQAYPKSNLDENQYNEDVADHSSVQMLEAKSKLLTSEITPKINHNASFLSSDDTKTTKIKPKILPTHPEISSSDEQNHDPFSSLPTPKRLRSMVVPPFGGVGYHTSARQANAQLHGTRQDLAKRPLSMAEFLSIERILDEMKGSISDLRAEYGTKFEEEVKCRKFWSAVARDKSKDIRSLQEQVAAIQNDLKGFKNPASQKTGPQVLMESRNDW